MVQFQLEGQKDRDPGEMMRSPKTVCLRIPPFRGWVMGIEEGTFWDEHWVLYGNQFVNKFHIKK